MKILPDVQSPPAERLAPASQSVLAFEDCLDLAATLRVRQTGHRAFAFVERGVLALSGTAGDAVTMAGKSPLESMPAAPVEEIERLPTIGQSAACGIRSEIEEARVAANAPASDAVISVARPAAASRTTVRLAGTPTPTSSVVEGEAVAEGSMGVGGPDLPAQDRPAGSDATLTVSWTEDGLVVFAAAAITSPEEIGRLRARAESIAREHGSPLVQFHFNGATVAPQPLSRRL